jgi:hypothetical protein
MSSVHSPQQKKELSYNRDHRAKGKYDKAFRKTWPLKKRKAVRSFRRAANSLTARTLYDAESDATISSIKQKKLKKWGAPSLREDVERRMERRERRIGAKVARRKSRVRLAH